MNTLTHKVKDKRTICEVHREMWDLIDAEIQDETLKNKLFEKIEEAYVMAKKMNEKLRQYKHNYDDGWWEKQQKEIVESKRELRKNR